MKDITRDKKVNIRVTSDEKAFISKSAKKLNMGISDYVRMLLLMTGKKTSKQDARMGILLVKSQEIINYIQDTYGNDKELERMVEELWEIS